VVARRASDADALVKLLASPVGYEGVVLLGGERLEDVERAHARRLLLVEPHHADLFTGTIATNVAVHASASAAGVFAAGDLHSEVDLDEAVLRAAAADEVIDSQADGHAAVVAERGASLSGGQRQRLALARALLARPPMLVLHDPTTAVDAVTEHAIAQGIRALRHGPGSGFGTIVITSSPALLAATDRVVVLGDGTVAVEGVHAGLGADDETYRQMVLR
jgi:putative ABC transport system ATP-binding protein